MTISRLQLAAALMEYDNDVDLASPDSETEFRDHRSSAIFQPFQAAQAAARRHKILSQPPPSLPSPLESHFPAETKGGPSSHSTARELDGPESQTQSFRKSTFELDNFTLTPGGSRNLDLPPEEEHINQQEEEDLGDVDVKRWGLPSHLIADEAFSSTSASRSRNEPELTTRRSTVFSSLPQPLSSPIGVRARSIHVQDVLDDTALHSEISEQSYPPELGDRRRTLSYDLTSKALASAARVRELAERPHTVLGMQNNQISPEERRRSKFSISDDPRLIPLPQTPGSNSLFNNRPLSSLNDYDNVNRGWISPPPGKMDEELMINEEISLQNEERNPFALPAPPPELGSRFDPKVLQNQRGSTTARTPREDERRFSEVARDEPPQSARSRSTFHGSGSVGVGEPLSNLSPGLFPQSKVWEDIPTPEQFGRPLMPKRYSTSARVFTKQMIRPKTLIMPTPLSGRYSPEPRQPKLPEGYTLGEKPLPYGAKTEGQRPGISMSVSQRTFRSSLMVNGVRDLEFVGGAEEDGEIGLARRELDDGAIERRPGKLFGRSLMDELEARKAAQKGKKRVFTGDARPAMMARSTMYDPPTISLSPTSPPLSGSVNRPTSLQPGRAPLLSFDSNGDIHPTSPTNLGIPDPQGRLAKSKSVFGVDQLWEKEMMKLKAIQEEEKKAAELVERIEHQKELKKMKKGKGRGKGNSRESAGRPLELRNDVSTEDVLGISPIKRASNLPPALEYTPEQVPNPNKTKDTHEEEEEEQEGGESGTLKLSNLFAGSEEDDQPAPAPHDFAETLGLTSQAVAQSESDSEENVPLSRLAPPRTAAGPLTARRSILSNNEVETDSDPDEDVPLSRLTVKSPVKPIYSAGLSLPTASINSSSKSPISAEVDDANEEDDLPLAVRQAKSKGLKPITKAEIIEDDLPLGYKHAEKAQKQMEERQWENRYSSASYTPEDMPMPIGMGNWQTPTQSWMISQHPANMNMNMNLSPYTGVMGYPSMPNLANPQMNMNMPIMGMGMGMSPQINMSMGTGVAPEYFQPVSNPYPGKAIDSWRMDVALAPVPTGSTRVSTPSGIGGGSAGR
ncbi:uncharacterized protein IL334_004471 [Kwoniella shivajii]|uniref:Uncharacterized protein n=1 Tax=Kwoniella shivajii TaxID=564305 RepID=A0ABZ1D1S1_9TREE|nr:hypothetical protein IL334_004471 [Kwoniella shivajii]